MKKLKYVLVGCGSRSVMYLDALCGEFKEYGEIAGICDINRVRMQYWQKHMMDKFGHGPIPMYHSSEFDRMIEDVKPDRVIVTSMDRTHHAYICRAMELGCDVITEKPMTIDAEKCQRIIDTKKRTGRNLIVTFNYRYAPRNTKVKELLKSGIAGEITTVTFEWLLDTNHGASYYQRWNRFKTNSGGLLVHKASHHFDLMNWWLESAAETVYAMGSLKFYGRENAERRGITEFYDRSNGNSVAMKDPFGKQFDPVKDKQMLDLYFGDAEKEDGYMRDKSVFSDGITAEDNMNVMVRYENGTVMNYCLYSHAPWEGYRICFNGTKGRLEVHIIQRPYVLQDEYIDMNVYGEEVKLEDAIPEIVFQPLWGKPRVIECEDGIGAHGGGDVLMLKDVLTGVKDDPLGHAAGYIDGAKSVLPGIAANISIETGKPVSIKELVRF